ncbi:MAG: type II toxin-antitoxin system RelE/ParE family toxin [Betaproteobacteria bacterium]|nr:type II toxin-antitoxin system RelE/ParE family toxin [Betaproteobacteria bacterium]
MIRRLILRPEAEGDIVAAREWYEERRRGLSLEFREALDETLSRIDANPELHARVYRELRRALLRRFPFGVFYVILPAVIPVLAVLHTSRDPALWRARYRRHG